MLNKIKGVFSRLTSGSQQSATRDSRRMSMGVFYAIVGIAAVVFVLFWLVGFDVPYDENPDYNAPILTGALITFMLLLVVATLALAVWSVARGMRMSRSDDAVVNNVPARRITIYVAAGTVLVLLATFIMSSTTPLTVNGTQYTDTMWLRVSGMFIATSTLLIAAAVAAVVYGNTHNIRNNDNAHKA